LYFESHSVGTYSKRHAHPGKNRNVISGVNAAARDELALIERDYSAVESRIGTRRCGNGRHDSISANREVLSQVVLSLQIGSDRHRAHSSEDRIAHTHRSRSTPRMTADFNYGECQRIIE